MAGTVLGGKKERKGKRRVRRRRVQYLLRRWLEGRLARLIYQSIPIAIIC